MLNSFTIFPIETSPTPHVGSLKNLGGQLAKQVKRGELNIQNDIKKALDPSGQLMPIPPYIAELFSKLDEQATSPEQKAMFSTFKEKLVELYQEKNDLIRKGLATNSTKFQLEISMKAINKTMSSIQQILSSQ